MKIQCFFFVQFRAIGYNESGIPYSLEPRKWLRVLTFGTNPRHLGLPLEIEAVGLSEWPTSLNLELTVDDTLVSEELDKIKNYFPGVARTNIFVPGRDTPPLRRMKPATIIQFPAQAA